jgi:ribosomal protein L12E/L44/L45/RPP1/RPP2
MMNTQQAEEIKGTTKQEIHLARLSNDELHERLKNKSGEERKLTHHILQLISEVDQRKLYLRMAYSSLFDYLTKELGYSAGSAQRRIDSARLLRQVPNLGNKIEDGRLNLSQVSQVQKVLRLARKQDNTELLPKEKEILLEKLQNKSGSETELILAQEFDFPVEAQFKQKLQKDSSVRLELTLSKDQMEVLEQAKALLAHALSGGNLVDVIVHLAERYVKQRKGTSSATVAHASPQQDQKEQQDQQDQRDQKSLKISVKKKVLNRDQGCQFTNRQTGKLCGSTYFAAYYYPHLLTLD